MLRIDTVRLAGALLLGCLCSSLPGNCDAANMRALYWSCADNACGPVTGPDGDPAGILLGYIKENAEPGTVPLYWACAYIIAYEGCGQRMLVAQPRYDDSVLLGYIGREPQPGTMPLYWSCKRRNPFGECGELAPDNSGDNPGGSVLLGHVYTE